jgi:hypothetical protein
LHADDLFTGVKANLQAFMRKLYAPQWLRLGWSPVRGEPPADNLSRALLIGALVGAEDPEVAVP